MTIEARLLEARTMRGLSQAAVAKAISESSNQKIPRQTYSCWEKPKEHRDHRDIRVEMIPHVAKALGFNLEWFFTGVGPREDEPEYRIMYLSQQLLNKTTEPQRRGIELIFGIDFPLAKSSVQEYSLGEDRNGDNK